MTPIIARRAFTAFLRASPLLMASSGIRAEADRLRLRLADPTIEAALGFVDRDAVNPLEQLKALSGDPGAFTFVPANDPTGQPVPCKVTSTASPTGAAPAAAPPALCGAGSGLQRSSGATVGCAIAVMQI